MLKIILIALDLIVAAELVARIIHFASEFDEARTTGCVTNVTTS